MIGNPITRRLATPNTISITNDASRMRNAAQWAMWDG
jgi:hypothetical protein